MARNLILFVASAAVMLLGFFIYVSVTALPNPGTDAPVRGAAELPTADIQDERTWTAQGGVKLAPGQAPSFTVYDDTGRATQSFRCETWEKVPGKENLVRVTEPELRLLLPSGMEVEVRAERGELELERMSESDIELHIGELEGDARIIVDRGADPDRPDLGERPEDKLEVRLDSLSFDLDRGVFGSDGPLEIESAEFTLTGDDFELVWNEAANRIESFRIERGEQLVLSGRGGLFSGLSGGKADKAESQPESDAVPADAPATTSDAYRCTLHDAVRVRHERGEHQIGGIDASALTLLFDMRRAIAAGDDEQDRREPNAANAPTTGGGEPVVAAKTPNDVMATQPAEEREPERLTVAWSGPLELTPADPPAKRGPYDTQPLLPRRRVIAEGDPVVLMLPGDRQVTCGRLAYFDETQQVWLRPQPGQRVELELSPRSHARAEAIFIDGPANLVKLIGDVRLSSVRGDGGNAQTTAIEARLWAELYLRTIEPNDDARAAAASGADLLTDETASGITIDRATFVGEVDVDLLGNRLAAHRLDVAFAPPAERAASQPATAGEAVPEDATVAATQSLQDQIQSVVAVGGVRLMETRPDVVPDWLRTLQWRIGDVVRPGYARYAQKRIREPQALACVELTIDFADNDEGRRVPTSLVARGDVRLRDFANGLRARGRRLVADIRPLGPEQFTLDEAVIHGRPGERARVLAPPYEIRGNEIVATPDDRRLVVNGWSWLRFAAEYSFEGVRRDRATFVTVTSQSRLSIEDAHDPANPEYGGLVRFSGEVRAVSGNESLESDTLTLVLRNVLEEFAAPVEPMGLRDAVGAFGADVRRTIADARAAEQTTTAPVASAAQEERLTGLAQFNIDSSLRKEPSRLIAQRANIHSDTPNPAGGFPLIERTIAAPELEVDILSSQIRTNGETHLLMISRALDDQAARRATAGPSAMPSALVADSPSQTAMASQGGMTYVIGENGPNRRDQVLFRGGVQFCHLAGNQVKNLSEMIPEVAGDRSRMQQLGGRNVRLDCDKLEGEFVIRSVGESVGRQSSPMELARLNATGDVWLDDTRNGTSTEILAHQIEFDREFAKLRVLGSKDPLKDAQVFIENPQTGRMDIPATGPEFIIDLNTNQIQAGRTEMIFRRN